MQALGSIVTGSNQQTQYILDRGLLAHFGPLLTHQCTDIQAVSGLTYLPIALVGTCHLLYYKKVMHANSSVCHKSIQEAARIVSNITAGQEYQIQLVIDANLIPAITKILATVRGVEGGGEGMVSYPTNGFVLVMVHLRTTVTVGCVCWLSFGSQGQLEAQVQALRAVYNIANFGNIWQVQRTRLHAVPTLYCPRPWKKFFPN